MALFLAIRDTVNFTMSKNTNHVSSPRKEIWNALLSIVICFFQYLYILSIDFGKNYTICITGLLSALIILLLLLNRYCDKLLKKWIIRSAMFHTLNAFLSVYIVLFYSGRISEKVAILVLLAISNMIYDLLRPVSTILKRAARKTEI